ncbi:MAG: glycoside hydrolase family 43 protein [Pseudomonadota bacterium]
MIRCAITVVLAILLMPEASAAPPGQVSNPVIAGFAPDPSIERVGEDYYLINSTFEYFPGIPVFHSRDLVNWTLLSYALSDPAAVDLDRITSGGGIHAATIRHHDGVFYVITTNNVDGNLINFVVTATDPAGPWSAPQVIEGAPGIDPSLFFDDDGRVWYTGNRIPEQRSFPTEMEIWLQEFDLESMQLIGERHGLWSGCCQGAWAEGPHIYKRDGYYYLLLSEGGTAYEHALSVAISREITGPYENNPRNPILSHRQFGYDFPITGVGHADFVTMPDGRWYALLLGWRLVDGVHGILGRETFLAPVSWETEPYWWKEPKLTFPVVSPLTGQVDLHQPAPVPGTVQERPGDFRDDFDADDLGLEWNMRRTHDAPFHDLVARPGWLRLALGPEAIGERNRYSFLGIRQRDFEFEATTRLAFEPGAAGERAGMTVIQNDRAALTFTVRQDATGRRAAVERSQGGEVAMLATLPVPDGDLVLRARGDYLTFAFDVSTDGGDWRPVLADIDGTFLSPAVIPGYNYTGLYVGLYATASGQDSGAHADFDWFTYRSTADGRDAWYERQRALQLDRSR